MDARFNTWATVPATVAGAFALLTAVLYGIGSPWYRSLLGAVFFLLFLGSVPVFALVLVRRIAATIANGGPSTSGDGFGLLAFAVYTFVALVWAGVFVAVRFTRRHTPTPTPPLDGRHSPTASATCTNESPADREGLRGSFVVHGHIRLFRRRVLRKRAVHPERRGLRCVADGCRD